MSELALQQPLPAGDWITIAEAARRSGLDKDHLRNRCARYATRGLARKMHDVLVGQVTWHVHTSADKRFEETSLALVLDRTPALRSTAAEVPSVIEGTPEQVAVAGDRMRVLEALEALLDRNKAKPKLLRQSVRAIVTDFSAALAVRHVEISVSTLFGWRKEWLASGRQLYSLFPQNVAKPLAPRDNPYTAFFRILEAIYLAQNKPQKAVAIRDAAALAFKDNKLIPPTWTARRHLIDIEKKRPAAIILHREGPSAFRDKCLPFMRRDRSKIALRNPETGEIELRDMWSNCIWCADHHYCDTFVRIGKGKLARPWLTAILDIRSNRMVGAFWSLRSPDKYSVLQGMRDSIERSELALPDYWYVDNGVDFDAWQWEAQTKHERQQLRRKPVRRKPEDRQHIGGLLNYFGIKMSHALPYNARAKPIERAFGIFEQNFGPLTWTFCNSDPDSKPEGLEAKLRQPNDSRIPTFADYARDAEQWIFEVYNNMPFSVDDIDAGLTRNQVFAANHSTIKTTSLEMLRLLQPMERRQVTREGVEYNGVHYDGDCLADRWRTKVGLRIDRSDHVDDVRSLEVYDLDTARPIGIVTSKLLGAYGPTPDAVTKEARRQAKRQERLRREAVSVGLNVVGKASHAELLAAAREAHVAMPKPDAPITVSSIRMAGPQLDRFDAMQRSPSPTVVDTQIVPDDQDNIDDLFAKLGRPRLSDDTYSTEED